MDKIGFDNGKYRDLQSSRIRERIGQFGNKLYLEFGGKLFDDHHASRVLPGFAPDSKIRMLCELKEDAEIVITAYGTPARIALTALETLRAEGLKVGLFRPITLWPFPEEALRKLSKADHVKAFLDVEMSSTGQMIDDVRLSVEGRKPIHYLGHAGGVMPTVEEMVEAAKKALKEGK